MRTTVPEVLPAMADYLRQHPAGGSLHIWVDDGNDRDHDLDFCRQRALESGDAEGARLATVALGMTRTQRKRLVALAWSRVAA